MSKMLSDFIVNLPELPLFVLKDDEYKTALRNEKWLDEKSKLNFLKKYYFSHLNELKTINSIIFFLVQPLQ